MSEAVQPDKLTVIKGQGHNDFTRNAECLQELSKVHE